MPPILMCSIAPLTPLDDIDLYSAEDSPVPHIVNSGIDDAEQDPLPSFHSGGDKQIQAKQSHISLSSNAEHQTVSLNQSQLCVALVVQKSKPNDMSTRDYILELRKHIRQGRRPADGEHRYIDTAEFWKDQYTKMHLEKRAIKTRLAHLELLSNQSPSEERAATFDLCSYNTASNWQHEIVPSNAESTANLPLLRQALILHRLLKDDKVATDTLVKAIRSSLAYVNSAISDACKTIGHEVGASASSSGHTPLHIFHRSAVIFDICLKGFTHLCRDIQGRQFKGQVIFPLVQVFVKALGYLDNVCVQRAVHRSLKTAQHQEKAPDFEDTTTTSLLLYELTKFLINILACPEFQKGHISHGEVLEGMFSALLREVGGLVSRVTFDEDLSTFHKPVAVPGSDTGICASVKALATDLKCKYLALILRRALKTRSEKDQHFLITALAGTKLLEVGTSKVRLLAQIKQRLQETLIRGIFGNDVEEFMNDLKMPESEENRDDEVPQVQRNEREAFLESVWSTVGWDILSVDD